MAHYSHVIYACYKNLRQITSLRGYVHPIEQPVLIMPQMLCPFAAH